MRRRLARGNAARNSIPGPRSFVLNGSVGRSFPVWGEQRRLELRLEGNNVLNTVNFTSLGTTINAADYGLPTNTAQMRRLSVELRFRF